MYTISLLFYVSNCMDEKTSNFKKGMTITFLILLSSVLTLYMIYNPENPDFFFVSFIVLFLSTMYFHYKFSYYSSKIQNISEERKFYFKYATIVVNTI
jgi:hypothetical protein